MKECTLCTLTARARAINRDIAQYLRNTSLMMRIQPRLPLKYRLGLTVITDIRTDITAQSRVRHINQIVHSYHLLAQILLVRVEGLMIRFDD